MAVPARNATNKKRSINVQEDDIKRRASRKLVLLAMELKKTGLRPTWFGLPSNPVVEGFFTENVSSIDVGVLEIKKDDGKLDIITKCLEVNRASIIDKKDHMHDTGTLVTRFLVDTKKMI